MSDSTKQQKRCSKEGCRCKLKLTDYPCRCGQVFCGTHRVAETHDCTFDYKAYQKDVLLKTMSTPIVAEKIRAI
jgi:AN1-type zinc finger protein 5/6